MKLVLDVNFKKELEVEDILVFNGKEWINLSKKEFLAELAELKNKCEKLENNCENLMQLVKELRGED